MDALVFTDGSSRGNPGPGGWGAILSRGGTVSEICGGEKRTTNNRMELMAAAEALSRTQPRDRVTVVTDSAYVANGASKWVRGWEAKGWKTATGQPVKNEDIWQRIADLSAARTVTWRTVAGHSGHAANERCDELATAAADGTNVPLYQGPAARYPFSLSVTGSAASGSATATGARRLGATSSGARLSGGAFSYVSLVDGVAQRHRTWTECHERVRGVANARFRKTKSADDEAAILASWGASVN